jgi:16S rRNA (uracil1498-N3)-methyltransferase
MPRHFFVPPEQISGDRLLLTGSEARHAITVLRLRTGDRCEAFDGEGTVYSVQVKEATSGRLVGTIVASRQAPLKSPLYTHLLQVVPRSSSMEWLVRKACELGIDCITPLTSERSRAKHPEGLLGRAARWRRVAVSAAKQCGRAQVAEIADPQALIPCLEGLAIPTGATLLVLNPGELRPTSRTTLESSEGPAPSAAILLVGPEGGLTEAELECAGRMGFQTLTLGQRILRSETAGLAGLVLVQHYWGDLA